MKKRQYLVKAAPASPFLKLNEAAVFLNLTPKSLRIMVANGTIPCLTSKNGKSDRLTYLFSRQELERLANGSTN